MPDRLLTLGAARDPDDWLVVEQIREQYGYPTQVTESLMKNLSRRGLVKRVPGFRRRMVLRKYVEPQSGGTTWE